MAEDKQKTNSKAEDQAPEDQQQPKGPEDALEDLNNDDSPETETSSPVLKRVRMSSAPGAGIVDIPPEKIDFNIRRGYKFDRKWWDSQSVDDLKALVQAGYIPPQVAYNVEKAGKKRKTLFEWLEKFE